MIYFTESILHFKKLGHCPYTAWFVFGRYAGLGVRIVQNKNNYMLCYNVYFIKLKINNNKSFNEHNICNILNFSVSHLFNRFEIDRKYSKMNLAWYNLITLFTFDFAAIAEMYDHPLNTICLIAFLLTTHYYRVYNLSV